MRAAAPEDMHVLQCQECLACSQCHIKMQRKLCIAAQALQLRHAPETQENVPAAAAE